MKDNIACNQLFRTNMNVNYFAVIYLNALFVVQKRYICTTLF